MPSQSLEFYCPSCAHIFTTDKVSPPSDAGRVVCPECGGDVEAAFREHAQSAERVIGNTPSQLLNPMPWWLIHAGVQIIARFLVKANVPPWLRDSARKSATPIDDVILDALASALEKLAEGARTSDDGE